MLELLQKIIFKKTKIVNHFKYFFLRYSSLGKKLGHESNIIRLSITKKSSIQIWWLETWLEFLSNFFSITQVYLIVKFFSLFSKFENKS